ncbi:MAG: FAA hydrolase family protein [Hyphomicrobiales bacterium]|nr:MAG: FAA hydrolase family protein [Hyphomicrobiales bacterium]
MKLMMFSTAGSAPRLGVVTAQGVVDVQALDKAQPTSILDVIAAAPASLAPLKAAADKAPATAVLALDKVKAELPIAHPPKFICVGLNYLEHAKEGGHPPPTYPSFFARYDSSLVAHGAPVIRPKCSIQLDYECELTIVIGKGGRHIPEAKALEHVFGYTIFNDVSVRDFQRKTTQWLAGKNFDGTGPLGPVVVTADALPAGATPLRIQTRVNGKSMQDSNTSDMIFSVAKTVALLSEFMTLEPGDLMATGTPQGVAHARKPPAWMKAGDIVEIEIEGIGVLSNPIRDEE